MLLQNTRSVQEMESLPMRIFWYQRRSIPYSWRSALRSKPTVSHPLADRLTRNITSGKTRLASHSSRTSRGSRTLRPHDISAPRHFSTNLNHRWSCVFSELSWVESVPSFRRSDAEVSPTTFLAQKCLETVLKCLMRVRSVLWPKCPVTLPEPSYKLETCHGNTALWHRAANMS